MGLLDSILGNVMGAVGTSMQGRGSSTSPIVQALMALVAAKAFQHHRSGSQDGSLGASEACWVARAAVWAACSVGAEDSGGGMPGGLGGLLGGLLNQFRQNGYGDHADSLGGNGPEPETCPGRTLSRPWS
jgi:hypothetical protein